MKINNPNFYEPVTFNENHYTSEVAQLRQIADGQTAGNQELTEALGRLVDAVEAGNMPAAQKNASTIMKGVGSGTLANVLSTSVLALIKHFAGE